MTETFKKYICSNCNEKCEEGIVIEIDKGLTSVKCIDYEKEKEVESYTPVKIRTAKQRRPLMKCV